MSDILLHTDAQAAVVNTWRARFDASQAAMGERFAFDEAGYGDGLTGNAATLPLDAWRRIDTRSVAIQRAVLVLFNRLQAASNTPIGIGDIVSYFPKISDSGEVNVSMDGRSKARADVATVQYEGTPVPLFDSTVRMGWRAMEVMRKGGVALDSESIANSQRRVAEKLESVALNGEPGAVIGGNKVYGLRTLPQRYTTTTGVALNGATGAQWLTVIGNVVKFQVANNIAYGNVTVFVNWNDWIYATQSEFAANYPKTIAQRVREIEQIAEIVPVPGLAPGEVIGIADLASGEWGTILSAMPMTTRALARANPEDDYQWNIIAAAVPQFRSDANGKSKIVHLTQA